ncbi:MAG: hypothetical protein DI498_03530 [Paracoccus denitrificans]|nr:MAG: hypothetical protein DI498_03530 [Paracoccus denitrificans]PZO85595.1 MAG: hypothetical protein DI633_03530 [Paracoccus denitrificans]
MRSAEDLVTVHVVLIAGTVLEPQTLPANEIALAVSRNAQLVRLPWRDPSELQALNICSAENRDLDTYGREICLSLGWAREAVVFAWSTDGTLDLEEMSTEDTLAARLDIFVESCLNHGFAVDLEFHTLFLNSSTRSHSSCNVIGVPAEYIAKYSKRSAREIDCSGILSFQQFADRNAYLVELRAAVKNVLLSWGFETLDANSIEKLVFRFKNLLAASGLDFEYTDWKNMDTIARRIAELGWQTR